MTRDENNHPILELAAAMTEAADHLSYTFRLRQDVVFHNNKKMTSADVVASFDRYAKIGNQRSLLNNVKGWDAPDPATFVIHMKVAQPTFIEALSSFGVPIVIIPAESRDVPAGDRVAADRIRGRRNQPVRPEANLASGHRRDVRAVRLDLRQRRSSRSRHRDRSR